MQGWAGKIIGAAVGFVIGRLVGALIGLILGHQFDRGFKSRMGEGLFGGFRTASAQTHEVFFRATFSVMGHIAKADGRVSELEIQAARSVMYHMRLSPEQVTDAIRWFTAGKQPDFRLQAALEELRKAIGMHHALVTAFLEIQVQSAAADGNIAPERREVLWQICQHLGVSRVELAQIEALVFAQRRGQGAAQQSSGGLRQAYRVLGVEPGAGDKEVKTAYRRLMSLHHPDKLVARGLPEEMMQDSKQKIREIRAAYDAIKAARQLK
ncbi:MAG: co-chaperone DjlA [Gammaproteobacteria bacterium]|nr:co-chaperone DjlA [Gammaproteobacteria bacterium]